jgi:hypothetical protein
VVVVWCGRWWLPRSQAGVWRGGVGRRRRRGEAVAVDVDHVPVGPAAFVVEHLVVRDRLELDALLRAVVRLHADPRRRDGHKVSVVCIVCVCGVYLRTSDTRAGLSVSWRSGEKLVQMAICSLAGIRIRQLWPTSSACDTTRHDTTHNTRRAH